MRRKWIKLWVDDWLDGSIRKDLNASETGVWADLLAMAGHSRNPGVIQFSRGMPYDHRDLAGRLRRPLPVLESTLRKCKKEGRLHEDEDGIHIVNFFRYQPHLRAEMKTQLPLEEPPPPEELSSERLAKQAELDIKLPKRELRKLSPERQEAARAYKDDPDKFIKGKYGHMVRR